MALSSSACRPSCFILSSIFLSRSSISRSIVVPSSKSRRSFRRRKKALICSMVQARPYLKKAMRVKFMNTCAIPQGHVSVGNSSYKSLVTKLTTATNLMKLLSAGPARSSKGPPICSPMPNVSYTSLSGPTSSPFSFLSMPKRMYFRAASQAWPVLIKNMLSEKQTELPPLTSIIRPLKPNSWPITKGAANVWHIGANVSLKDSMAACATRTFSGTMCVAGKVLSVRAATFGLFLQKDTRCFAILMHEVSVCARKSMVKMMPASKPARVNSDSSWPMVCWKFLPSFVYLSASSAPSKEVVEKKAFCPATHLPLWDICVPMTAQALARWCAISFTVVRWTMRLALFATAP
mmetsp:Transcript_75906/g.245811  ORF Transcript_75906/g.245811 Transcript_75906/m.245811 type:complete len:349 (+) Transcript_75906:37-1083(+)